uniref:Cytochrome P450 3038C1 n=1 Tax=Paracyclopina nana TaxID=565004 RepID=A0A0F7J2S8_PARNA|nr:cytochrome P450 3038C1 [Paracyclopina nana]
MSFAEQSPLTVGILIIVITLLLKKIHKAIFAPWENCPPGVILGMPSSFNPVKVYQQVQLISSSPLKAFHQMIQENGPIIRISTGGNIAVLLGGLEAIKEFSSMEETTARPYNKTLLDLYSMGEPLGFGIGIGGPRWKEQRRFATKALKDLYEGQRGLEEKIQREVYHTIQDLRERIARDKMRVLAKTGTYFEVPNLNVIWGLVGASRYTFEDAEPKKQFGYLRTLLGEKLAGPMTFVPYINSVPPFSRIYKNIINAMDSFRETLIRVIAEQKATFDESNPPRGYIDLFLKAQKEGQGEFFTNKDLLIGCQDLFIAGSETTSSSLTSLILYMILYPDVQKRVQQEIDDRVGTDREVTFADKANLPFTDATIMEVRRIASPFPVTPPRASMTKDLVIGGYTIPKGVPVQLVLYSVLRGKDYWEDPDKFDPDRFFDDHGKLVVPEAFIPFSYGKRRCIGEKLGIVSNFIFFANLMQNFSFSPEDPKNPPSEELVGGLTYCPEPFNVRITPRF